MRGDEGKRGVLGVVWGTRTGTDGHGRGDFWEKLRSGGENGVIGLGLAGFGGEIGGEWGFGRGFWGFGVGGGDFGGDLGEFLVVLGCWGVVRCGL